MKLAARRSQRSDLAFSDGKLLSDLLSMPGRLVIVSFRGTRLRVLAADDVEGQRVRSAAVEPVTDPLHLELLTGTGEATAWRRPVALQAVVESRSDPALAVQRASRWASYAARVAVVPNARLNDQALLEARLRGVRVVTVGAPGQFQVAAVGESAATAGSVRGLAHRLLDELVWEALLTEDKASAATARGLGRRSRLTAAW
jgi:hypothetical protein